MLSSIVALLQNTLILLWGLFVDQGRGSRFDPWIVGTEYPWTGFSNLKGSSGLLTQEGAGLHCVTFKLTEERLVLYARSDHRDIQL
jgi:hypothetical protein